LQCSSHSLKYMRKKKDRINIKMKKRGVIFVLSIFILLFLIPNAFSLYEEKIFSETVEDKDLVEISEKLFKFRIDSTSNKVVIDIIDDTSVIIRGGECEITGNFDICISNITFSYRNLEDYVDVYKALVSVYQIKSKLDTTHTILNDKILIDEETTAELTIENTADLVAEDVVATMEIPPSLQILDTEGCKKSLNTITFKEDVHPKQIKKCTYKVKGLTEDDFDLKADISFFDGAENVNTTSDTISGKVYPTSLKMISKLDKKNFDIKEKFDLKINFQNINDQYDMSVSKFNIKIPPKFLILNKPKVTTENNQIIGWAGTLKPEETQNFTIQLQALRSGEYSVIIETNYKINRFSRSSESKTDIEISCNCPYIQHDFSQGIAVANQRLGLKVYLTNPNPDNTFSSVEVGYSTNIPNIQDFSTAYSQIRPLETINIFDSSIITPPLEEIYHFNITAVYKSESNQIFVEKDNVIIKIPQVEEPKIEEEGAGRTGNRRRATTGN